MTVLGGVRDDGANETWQGSGVMTTGLVADSARQDLPDDEHLASPRDYEKSALAEFQLFRPEALAEARDRYGRPAPIIGLSSALLTAFLVLLLVGTVAMLAVMRYSRKETVIGVLTPSAGAMHVSAPRNGVISAVHVRNDQEVVSGQPLVTLQSDTTTTSGVRLSSLLQNAAKDQADALSLQLNAAAASAASAVRQSSERRAALQRQLGPVQRNIELLRERLRLAEETAAASRQLQARQYLSVIVLRQREDAVLSAKQSLINAEQALADLSTAIAQTRTEESRLLSEHARDKAGLSLQLAQVRERDASVTASAELQLVAPQDGRIALLHAKPGVTVVPNANIATIVPKGARLEAELWVPSSAIGFVRRGDTVRLMYDAFPYERFGAGKGTVLQIDRAPTSPAQLGEAIKSDEGLYRVLVALSSQTVDGYRERWPLVPGMRLKADIVLEGQTLLEWIFDQLRASAKREGI